MNKKVKLLIVSLVFVNIFAGIFFFLKSRNFFGYSNLANNFVFIVSVLFFAYFVTKIINIYIVEGFRVKRGLEKTPQLFNRFVTLVIYIIAFIIILDYFEIQITPILAGLGIAGLAVGLALQSTLSNLFSGLQILGNKPIRVGDYVEVDNYKGYVEDIGWRSVRIKTIQNNLVIIPNSKLIDSIIINDSMPEKQMSVLVQVGVDYGSDLKRVEKITLEVARKIQKTFNGAVENFEPLVRYHTLGDNNINFTVVLRIKEFLKKYLIKHEFIKALKERYDKENIEISWPIRKITNMDKPRRRR